MTDNKYGLILIEDLFKNKNFIIPDYQRGYSWEIEHQEAFLKDVMRAIELDDYIHFTGTIVVHHTENGYEVVDGQQRLTTLVILLKVLYNKINKEISFEEFNKKFSLQLNKETNDFYKGILFFNTNPAIDNKSCRSIKNCYDLFNEKLDDIIPNVDLKDFEAQLMKKIGFLFYITTNHKNIGAMFEIINNRGKSLSQLEKIKNYLIYYATVNNNVEIKELINTLWGKILYNLMKCNKVSNEEENSFLRYLWVVFSDTKIKDSYDIYSLVKDAFPDEGDIANIEDVKSFIHFIHSSSRAYLELFTSDNIFCMNLRNHSPLVPILPLFISIKNSENVDEEEKNELLNLIEILNFRVYVLPSKQRSDKGQSTLFALAYQFYNDKFEINKDDKNEIELFNNKDDTLKKNLSVEVLKYRLIKFINENCDENTFVQNLTLDIGEKYDYYKWNGLKFFLANYEVYLSQEKDGRTEKIESYLNAQGNERNDKQEKEHIWARANREFETVITTINDKKEKIKQINLTNLHEKSRLGNFVLLHKNTNIVASNSDLSNFEGKVASKYLVHHTKSKNTKKEVNFKLNEYKKINKQNIQVNNLEEYHNNSKQYITDSKKDYKFRFLDYYQNIIDLNETELVNFALKRWSYPNEKLNKFIIDSKLAQLKYQKSKDSVKVYFKKSEYKESIKNANNIFNNQKI